MMGYHPGRRTQTPSGFAVPRRTALQTVVPHPILLPDAALWRHRRAVLEAISLLRDPVPLTKAEIPYYREYWLARTRHYRRLHSQVVAALRAEAKQTA